MHQAGAAQDDVMLHLIYPSAESALFLTAVINPLIYMWRNALVREGLKAAILYKNYPSKTEVTDAHVNPAYFRQSFSGNKW